jgi:hypothetical protein
VKYCILQYEKIIGGIGGHSVLKILEKKQDSFFFLFPITFVGVDLFGSLSINILLIFVSQPQEQRQLLKLLPKSNTDLDMYRKEKFGINMRSQFLMSGQF